MRRFFNSGIFTENIPIFLLWQVQFGETCVQTFSLTLIATLSIAFTKTQFIFVQENCRLIEGWTLKVLLFIRGNRWLTVLVHVEFLKWVFCITMLLYDFSFVSSMIEAERFPVLLSGKKIMKVGISMFNVLTSSYKIIQLSRSPFTSVMMNLNKFIYLFLTTMTRDPPYGSKGN